MKFRIGFLLVWILGLPALNVMSQPGVDNDSRKWSLNGYLKYMQTVNVADGTDSLLVDNLLHNRLNFQWFPSESLNFRVDLRSRVFYGDLVDLIPQYGKFIDVNNDYFDLSWMPVNRDNLVFHTMIDRAYLRWTHKKLEMTLGRQRINWGINLAWNPNDIFNAYSFFDFDYEERPGSDAFRLVYYTGFASSVQFAVKAADDVNDLVAAGLWKTNRWNYDFQLLGGVANGDYVLGGGWAGSIAGAGFKGEVSYFHPFPDNQETAEKALVASVAGDYSLNSGLYFNLSYLFNSNGSGDTDNSSLNLLNYSNSQLTAKNLIPFRHSVFTQALYPVSPLLNASLSLMVFPEENSMFINPVITWSLKENLDLDLIGQIFLTTGNNDGQNAATVAYGRLKWSF